MCYALPADFKIIEGDFLRIATVKAHAPAAESF
jgi:hypothetical protein